MKFKDLPLGLFRYKMIVYTKINDHQGVIISTGVIEEFNPEEEVGEY